MRIAAALLCAMVLLQGCATAITRTCDGFGDQVYPATRLDVLGVAYLMDDCNKGGDEMHWLVVVPVVDIVPSLITDTVLLPIDLVVMAVK